jgi:antitoxin PrlF
MPVVTKKYQVTIPKEVRESLGIKAGDEVVFVKTREGYVIKPLDEFLKEMAEMTEGIEGTIEEVQRGLTAGVERSLKELEGHE